MNDEIKQVIAEMRMVVAGHVRGDIAIQIGQVRRWADELEAAAARARLGSTHENTDQARKSVETEMVANAADDLAGDVAHRLADAALVAPASGHHVAPLDRIAARARPPHPEEPIKALASAMRKLLPPELLSEVLGYLDPLTPFVKFLQTTVGEAATRPTSHPVWQPIETYHQEHHDYVLLVSPAHGLVIGGHVTGDVWHLVGVGAITSPSERPTHWQPLPAPPSGGRPSEEKKNEEKS